MNSETQGFDPGERIVRCNVAWDSAGTTLLDYLATRFTYRTQNEWRPLIEDGTITVNSQNVAPEKVLALHDLIEYRPGELPEPPANFDYQIVFEDDSILVIDKPGNLCVHPAGPFFKNTLWYLLVPKYGKNIHFVNRLDRETSGLMIVAKNAQIAAAIDPERIEKIYAAAVYGDFPSEAPSGVGFLYTSSSSLIRKMRFFAHEKPLTAPKAESASTNFSLLESNGKFSLVKAQLGTGRMHQIRATLRALGYPVVGDKLYGVDSNFYLKQKHDELTTDDRKKLILDRQALHAMELTFRHPISGENLFFRSEIPPEFFPDRLLAKA